MTKTTKTASFRAFEAAKLAAGKYAGMCISRSEEREHEGKFFTYYSSGARNVSRDWYGVRAADLAAIGYECLGFWDVPAGLKAAALMVCRISDISRNFRFGLDRSGAWMLHYCNPEGFEYSNGSAEDVTGDRVEMDDDQNARDFAWALSRFGRVQLWKKGSKIFMAVGSIDDGSLLLLNAGVKARFTAAEDDVWMVDPAAEIVAAVASYPAAPVAACGAPKAENCDAEGENARGGAEVPPEAKTAPKAKETTKETAPAKLERVTGEWLTHSELMAHPEKCPKLGDVVEVSDSPVKSQNGFFVITSWNSSKYCGNSSFYGIGINKNHWDDTTKNNLYWPPRNTSGTRAAHEANVRHTPKMRVLGPVSLAGLDFVRAELASAEKWQARDNSEESGRYVVECSLALARMEEENPALFRATRKAPEESGSGLKIAKNGLYVRESGKWELYRAFYSVDNMIDGRPCVTVFAREYGDLPNGFGLEIENDSDPYTDYVTGDRATVYEDHPLFKKFREAAAGAKHYHLTAEDVESVREYVENKMEAARKAREAEEAARAAKYEEQERHAREVIDEYVELFPGDAYHPHIIVEWSELGAMNDRGRLHGDATVFSVEAFEAITGDLDKYFEGDLGYNKLKFTFYPGGGSEFTDRCDLGDGGGSYGKRMRYVLDHARDRASNGEIMLDGGAVVELGEYEMNARKYLENLAVTWDEIGAA